jgi:hypothetical protein
MAQCGLPHTPEKFCRSHIILGLRPAARGSVGTYRPVSAPSGGSSAPVPVLWLVRSTPALTPNAFLGSYVANPLLFLCNTPVVFSGAPAYVVYTTLCSLPGTSLLSLTCSAGSAGVPACKPCNTAAAHPYWRTALRTLVPAAFSGTSNTSYTARSTALGSGTIACTESSFKRRNSCFPILNRVPLLARNRT